jgi:hypothetical protein
MICMNPGCYVGQKSGEWSGLGNSGRGAGEVCTRRLMRIHRNVMNGAAKSELRRDSSAATRYWVVFKRSPKEESAMQCYSGRLDSSGQCWA